MPEFNRSIHGIYCAGNAGDGGVVSSNNQRVVLGPNAGNAHWFNDREIACQYYAPGVDPQLVAVNYETGIWSQLCPDGVVKIVAGAGHWFAHTIHSGPLLDGNPTPNMNVRAFAGEWMAWFPWNGTGLILRGPDGKDTVLSTILGPEAQIQLFEDGSVLWAEAGRIKSHGMAETNFVTVPGGFGDPKAYLVDGVRWIAYQSYDLYSVVTHPANSTFGYKWRAPIAARLDVGNGQVIWSRGEADAPQDIEVVTIDFTATPVDLSLLPPADTRPPKITNITYTPEIKTGQLWSTKFTINDATITVEKDEKDRLQIGAVNLYGSDHTGLVRQLTVVCPECPPEPLPMTRFIVQPNIGVLDLFDSLQDLSPLKGHTISFYVQEINADASTPQWGNNFYANFVAHDVFRRLKDAGILLNVEMGSVKPGDCQAQGNIDGMQIAVQRVSDAGGEIYSFSVDEPLTANQDSCHQSMEACADAHAAFTRAVRALGPIKVIYLEAWPEVALHPAPPNKPKIDNQETFLGLLKDRDALPDGWRPDVDYNRAKKEGKDVTTFFRDARVIAARLGIQFGVFINSTVDPIPTDDQHHANLVALAQKLHDIIPDAQHVCVASWASRVSPDPTHASQNVPNNLGQHGLFATFNAVREMFDTVTPPEPEPPEEDLMLVTMIDPKTETLAVKDVKPIAGHDGLFTLVLADFTDGDPTTTPPEGPKVRQDKVFSNQPTGHIGDGQKWWREPGTTGQWEQCTVKGNVATFKPADKFITRFFSMVGGL